VGRILTKMWGHPFKVHLSKNVGECGGQVLKYQFMGNVGGRSWNIGLLKIELTQNNIGQQKVDRKKYNKKQIKEIPITQWYLPRPKLARIFSNWDDKKRETGRFMRRMLDMVTGWKRLGIFGDTLYDNQQGDQGCRGFKMSW